MLRRRRLGYFRGGEARGRDHPRGPVVTALGITQILAWGSSYYLPAVLAGPIAADTGWPLAGVIGGLSVGLLTAGLISPAVGRAINLSGGRRVMALSSVLLGSGLAGIGLSQSLPMFLVAWLVVGLGMGAGLYDAAFATLGRLYGRDARRSITALTLFGGFASTVCWPLSALMLEHLGWRGACLVYAAIQICLALPLHWRVLPELEGHGHALQAGRVRAELRTPLAGRRLATFLLLATTISLGSGISSMLSVHLLTILQAQGMALATAVALGALVGPSQVAARSVEMLFGSRYHPIWTKLAATTLVTTGVALLFVGVPILAVPLVLYGAGIGIESIARGTLPLAIFDADIYAALMGRIAMPSLVFQAVSPSIGAMLLDHGGPDLMLVALTVAAALNLVLVACLWSLSGRSPARG